MLSRVKLRVEVHVCCTFKKLHAVPTCLHNLSLYKDQACLEKKKKPVLFPKLRHNYFSPEKIKALFNCRTVESIAECSLQFVLNVVMFFM